MNIIHILPALASVSGLWYPHYGAVSITQKTPKTAKGKKKERCNLNTEIDKYRMSQKKLQSDFPHQ